MRSCTRRTVQVPQGGLDNQFIKDLGALIPRLAGNKAPKRVPSAQECRFCDISTADCPERMDDDYDPDGGSTNDF